MAQPTGHMSYSLLPRLTGVMPGGVMPIGIVGGVAVNPYRYGAPVVAPFFAGRDSEVAALRARVRDGINVVLMSPRRYGKTSLLLETQRKLDKSKVPVVYLNVLRTPTLRELVTTLAAGVYGLPGGRWHRTKAGFMDFLHRLRITPTVEFEHDKPRFTFAPTLAEGDLLAGLEDLYALLDELSAPKGGALVLDEFQDVLAVSPDLVKLPKVFKAMADKYQRVALVLAGSQAHLMDRLVLADDAPLYGMAEHLHLGPVSPEQMAAYLVDRAAAAGGPRLSAEVARLIIDLAGPVPNNIQRLAYASYELADTIEIGAQTVTTALQEIALNESAAYAEQLHRLAPGQRRVLAALAAGPVLNPNSAAFAATVALANAASVAKALRVLDEDGLTTRSAEGVALSDPFLAAWLRDPTPRHN